MTMQTKQQLETQATFQAALQRRQQTAVIQPSDMHREIIGRKKDPQSFVLALDRIRADYDQVRQQGKTADDEETVQLAASIREHGLIQPIDVRWLKDDDIYEIVAGERRYIAVKEILHWPEVPVRVLDTTAEQILWLQLHENLHRKNLHPLDLANAIQTAMQQGMTIDQVAGKLCKSETYVQKALTVAQELTPEAREQLQATPKGQSLDTAYEIATLPPERQEEVAKTVVEQGLNQRELRKLAAEEKKKAPESRKARGGRPTKAKPYERTLKAGNGAAVTIRFRKADIALTDVIDALKDVLATLKTEQKNEAA